VITTADLNFGAFVPAAGSGSLTLSYNGTRSATGGVILFTQGANASGNAAEFSISGGTPDAVCVFSITGTDALTGPGSNMTFSYDVATSDHPDGTITLDGSGAATVKLGGTVAVGGNQAAGSYSAPASLSITVTC
jgi:hypothetical protein